MTDLDSSILLAFLVAADEPVSGDRLAKELGVSRVAIWSRLEKLRARVSRSPRPPARVTGSRPSRARSTRPCSTPISAGSR